MNSSQSFRPLPRFKHLEAWRKSRELTVTVFRLTDNLPLSRRRGLCDQMQRAAISVPSNLAEGEDRGTNKDALRFLFMAKGSLSELRTQLDIAHAIGDLTAVIYGETESLADEVARLLSGMIKRRLAIERSSKT